MYSGQENTEIELLLLPISTNTYTFVKKFYCIHMKNTLTILSFLIISLSTTSVAQHYFYPTEQSLTQYNAPEWFLDAKIGYWVHWGIYSVPAYREKNDAAWYGRWMYALNEDGTPRGEVAKNK